MTFDYRLVLFGLLSYLAGGIPSGYLIARRLRGIDIREHGSGNPGAANVYRIVGPAAGWSTMAFDALKGWLPVVLAARAFPESLEGRMLCGALAIVGHVWTPFLGLRGGKGVATSAGVFFALMPVPALCAFAGFVLATALSGHISVGSMTAAALMPAGAVLFREPGPLTAMAALAAALVLVRHIPNLRRLLGRQEPPFPSARATQERANGQRREGREGSPDLFHRHHSERVHHLP